jgi:ribosome-binding protein aMBF1 (putative translation factor)
MPLAFRNLSIDPSDPVATWPTEAVQAALERGDLGDWHRLAAEVARQPWGRTARQLEEVLTYSRPYGVAEAIEAVIARARARAERREREEVAAEVRRAIDRSGLSRAEFASRLGTSASRLSTYATGKVVPAATFMVRMRELAGVGSGAGRRGAEATAAGVGTPTSFWTVGAAAEAAARMVTAGEPLGRVWRFVVVQMLDDYRSVRHHRGLAAAARMWQAEPGSTGDVRVDAALAALAEHLARRDGWPAPPWTRQPGREAVPWWFVTELRGFQPRALVESPSSFRRRGVFITRAALERV